MNDVNILKKRPQQLQPINPDIAIEVRNFFKKYRGNINFSVRDATFSVRKGEFHGFIGANGAGKTTTIKSIVGAYATYGGSISIFGIPNTNRQAKNYIGYIPEKADFPTGYSTLAYLKTIAVLRGYKSAEASTLAMQRLVDLGLEAIAHRSPTQLSSGQKKKILLAQALIHNPKVIIADEPAANLDPKARLDFFTTLKKLTQTEKITFLISSHILEELEKYIDSLTIIENGAIAYTGTMRELQKDRFAKTKFQVWDLKSPSYEEIVKIFEKEKVEFKEVQGGFEFSPKNNAQLKKIIGQLIDTGVIIQSLQAKGSDLAGIYSEFVKVGSADIAGGGHD